MSNNTKKLHLQKSGTLNLYPNKVIDPLFQTRDFFDTRDLLQVKYEMLRRVSVEGWPITKVTQQFGFSRPAFYQMQADYKKDGLMGLFPKKRGPKSPHKLTGEVVGFIKKILKKSSSETPVTLATTIKTQLGITIHPRSIERILLQKQKTVKKTP